MMADEPASTTNTEGLKAYVSRRIKEKRGRKAEPKKPSREAAAGTPPKKGRYGFPQQDDTVNWD
jgi:hypothetical protein